MLPLIYDITHLEVISRWTFVYEYLLKNQPIRMLYVCDAIIKKKSESCC
jgi:hypothetical protein